MFGSSPRTWGTQDDVAGFLLGFRFIPTHLGNACRLRNGSGMKTVHPHARGERGRRDERQVIHLGSSPRTWGTLVPTSSASRLRRFIPKHVGNARRTRHRQTPGPVHPHARGERTVRPINQPQAAGSSPRTWGTLPLAALHVQDARFIPTHVGNACAVGHKETP